MKDRSLEALNHFSSLIHFFFSLKKNFFFDVYIVGKDACPGGPLIRVSKVVGTNVSVFQLQSHGDKLKRPLPNLLPDPVPLCSGECCSPA